MDYLDSEMNISGGSTTDESILWSIDQHAYLSGSAELMLSIQLFNTCNKSIDAAINSIPLDSLSLYSDQNAGF